MSGPGSFVGKQESPEERLKFLVDWWNKKDGAEATPSLDRSMEKVGDEIHGILNEFPELGPVEMKQYANLRAEDSCPNCGRPY